MVRRNRTQPQERTRGQLILIAAVMVALTVVASVALLNSIHVSADVQSQQDGKSLEEAERVTANVQEDLEELFLVNGSINETGDRLPYVKDENEFAALVEAYDEQYTNMSVQGKTGIVSVEVAETTEGIVVRQNETDDFSDDTESANFWSPVEDADGVPYLNVTIEEIETGGADFTITKDGPIEQTIVVEDGGSEGSANITDENGDSICTASGQLKTPIEMEFINGIGTIRGGEGTLCTGIEFGADFVAEEVEFDLSASPVSGNVNIGTYTIVAAGDDAEFDGDNDWDSEDHRTIQDDVLVGATIEFVYQDPQVTYAGNTTLYGGGS